VPDSAPPAAGRVCGGNIRPRHAGAGLGTAAGGYLPRMRSSAASPRCRTMSVTALPASSRLSRAAWQRCRCWPKCWCSGRRKARWKSILPMMQGPRSTHSIRIGNSGSRSFSNASPARCGTRTTSCARSGATWSLSARASLHSVWPVTRQRTVASMCAGSRWKITTSTRHRLHKRSARRMRTRVSDSCHSAVRARSWRRVETTMV